jgi:hypothetical protein
MPGPTSSGSWWPNGPLVPPIKDARDKQPNDRQRQPEDDKCHRGANKHCEHEYPPTSFLDFKPTVCRAKKTGAMPNLPASAPTKRSSTPTSRPGSRATKRFADCQNPKRLPLIRLTFVGDANHRPGRSCHNGSPNMVDQPALVRDSPPLGFDLDPACAAWHRASC